MIDRITAVAQLEVVIGKTPLAIPLKVIDHLDPEVPRWIGAGTLAFQGFGKPGAIAVTLPAARPASPMVAQPSCGFLARRSTNLALRE